MIFCKVQAGALRVHTLKYNEDSEKLEQFFQGHILMSYYSLARMEYLWEDE
jgi:hypothetical protein